MSEHQIIIDPKFNGPPNSSNGGYICGLLAKLIPETAEVMLRMPPPLAQPMSWDADLMKLTVDGKLVAIGTSVEWELEVPPPPDEQAAKEAQKDFPGFIYHPFPACFVCGPKRLERDGLEIFPGPVKEDPYSQLAAVWKPSLTYADEKGFIQSEFIWAALDCPGAYTYLEKDIPLVLGKMSTKIFSQLKAELTCIVTAWSLGNSGRKYFSGTAIWQSNNLIAAAKSTWISLKK